MEAMALLNTHSGLLIRITKLNSYGDACFRTYTKGGEYVTSRTEWLLTTEEGIYFVKQGLISKRIIDYVFW
jgi:hypothetical protein